MTGSTTVSLLSQAVTSIGTMFTTLLPIIVPVAIALAGLYAILHWLTGSARRR